MTIRSWVVIAALSLGFAPAGDVFAASTRLLVRAPSASASPESVRAVLDRYCVGCHGGKTQTAGVVLEGVDPANVGERAELWERVVRKLRAGLMPPVNRPRPDRATGDAVLAYLESSLDAAAARRPDPGRTETLHRLNRTEYQHAVRDLLAVDVDVRALLPADDASYGFDNIAGVLKVSPVLMERYLTAAQTISRLAVGSAPPSPAAETFRVPPDLPQNDRVDGLPFGTRGGMLVSVAFPQDAEYLIDIDLQKNRDERFYLREPHQLELAIDGVRVQLFALTPDRAARKSAAPDDEAAPGQSPKLRARVAVKAGRHLVSATFLKKTSAGVEDLRQPFLRPYNASYVEFLVAVGSVTVTGPYDATGPGDTPSRRRIFVCRPATPGQEHPCARRILSALMRRAFRRPVTGPEVAKLMPFFDDGRAEGGFDAGIETALLRLLASPEFLFRIESDPAGTPPRTPYRISSLELASRLSFFLWSSIPDDELLDAAIEGRLSRADELERQVRRMLADARSESLVTSFAAEWLYLRNLPALAPDETLFPDFDASLRDAFRQETELFFESILRDDRSVLDLLTADYTFVNERLARHYGIDGVYGSHFRRVALPDGAVRGGLLGQGSILAVTSHADRTSPVLRGKWILENLFGTPPPAPPANVPPLAEKSADGRPRSMRDRMAAHRAVPVCAGCHATMDPLGLSLENFDAVGRWRTRSEAGTPLDTSGTMLDGERFDGVIGLRQALVGRSDLVVQTVTEKLLIYALGRGLAFGDRPAVRRIAREAASANYSLSAIIAGICRSVPFQMRTSQ